MFFKKPCWNELPVINCQSLSSPRVFSGAAACPSVLGWAAGAAEDCEIEGGEGCWGELWEQAEVTFPDREVHMRICAKRAVMHFGVMIMTSWKHQVSGETDNEGKMLGLTCRGLGSSAENNCSLFPFSMGHLLLHSHKQH